MHIEFGVSYKNRITFVLLVIAALFYPDKLVIGCAIVFGYFSLFDAFGREKIKIDEVKLRFSGKSLQLDSITRVFFAGKFVPKLKVACGEKEFFVGDAWRYKLFDLKNLHDRINTTVKEG